MKMKYIIFLCSTLILSGCLSPVKTSPPATYVVNSLPSKLPSVRNHHTVMLVLQPDERPIYQTTQMAYTDKRYQVQYFSENKWAETPAQMLLPLLTQTLQNTGRFSAVLAPPYTGHYNYVLSTQISCFEQDLMQHPQAFKLVARVSITRTSNSRLVASKEFSISVPISQQSPYDGVIAANMATKKWLQEVADFVVTQT